MAHYEIYLALAYMILNFDIALDCDTGEVFPVMPFACHPNKLPLRFTAR